MTRALARLAGGTAALWLLAALPAGLAALPAGLAAGGAALLISAAAALICLLPAALTLVLTLRAQFRPPEERVGIILAGIAARMVLTLAGGLAFYASAPVARANPWALLAWGLIFYLATLALETSLVMTRLRDAGTDPDGPLDPERFPPHAEH